MKRGLLNLKNTVDALPQLITKDVVSTFEKYKVLNERELHARYEVMVETYNKTVNAGTSCRRRCSTRRPWQTACQR